MDNLLARFRFGSPSPNNLQHSIQVSNVIITNNNDCWSCPECTFSNDSNSIQCKICSTQRCKKRKINQLDDIKQSPSKKRRKNDSEQNNGTSNDKMEIDENINNTNNNHNHNKPNQLNSKIIRLPKPSTPPLLQHNNNDDMESLYFPVKNNKNNDNNISIEQKEEIEQDDETLQLMSEFALKQPKKIRIKKENERPDAIYIDDDDDDIQIMDGDYNNIDNDFSSHLTDEMYAYYSGEDIDALDWSGSQYENSKLWELEKQFFKWKEIYKGCVLMIQSGYKYEFYEQDAMIISVALGVAANNKHGKLFKALLPENKLDSYLRRLVEVGLMIAVIQQTETGATKNKSHKMIERELTGVYTKGTLFAPHVSEENTDTDIFKNHIDEFPQSRYILCFHEIPLDNEFNGAHKVEFNIILVDLYSGLLHYQSFQDDFLRPRFLTILNHFNIVEIILPIDEISNNTKNLLNNRYPKLGNKNAVRWINYALKNFEFSESNDLLIHTFMEKHGEWIADILNWDKSIIISFAMLVHYLRKCGLHETLVHCRIEPLGNKMYMTLSGITTSHLEIFINNEGQKRYTLFELLSRNNKTAFGKRLMHQWVSAPLCCIKQIKLRQNAVKKLMEMIDDDGAIWLMQLVNKLCAVSDLERRLRIIQCKRCPPKLFLNAIKQFKELLNVLPNEDDLDKLDNNGLLYSLFSSIPRMEILNIINEFMSNLNMEMTGYPDAIRDISQYPKLVECHKDIQEAEKTLDLLLKQLRTMLNIPTLQWKSVKTDKYQIEIEKDKFDINLIPTNWKITSETKTAVRYQPVQVFAAASTLAVEQEKMLYEAKRAWFHFLDDFNKTSHLFCQFISALSRFDCLYSMTVLSTNFNYVLPQFVENKTDDNDDDDDDGQILIVKEGRHPTLEEFLSNENSNGDYGPSHFISNDINLSSSEIRQMLITGPNMGGKSVYIKMIASLIIMAQIGSYVPAQSMKLTPFDMIGTRLGIYDDILLDKSTFFVEMSETSHLISTATKKSFLILDELGRGTSTFDGTAMAYSILKHIIDNIKCMTLFVTHYNQLLKVKNEYDLNKRHIDNYYMTFKYDKNQNKVDFLYKISCGESKQSYGIQVAQLAGMEHDVLKQAKERSHNLEKYTMDTAQDKDQQIKEFQTLLSELNIVPNKN